MVSVSDTQGASTARPSRHIDITEITFPYKPGDYVVHAQHGIAHFKELVRREDRWHGARLSSAGIRRGGQAVRPGRAARPCHALCRPRGFHAAMHPPEHGRLVARHEEGKRRHQKARVRPGGRVRTPRKRARLRLRSRHAGADRDGGGVPVSGRRPTSWPPSPT